MSFTRFLWDHLAMCGPTNVHPKSQITARQAAEECRKVSICPFFSKQFSARQVLVQFSKNAIWDRTNKCSGQERRRLSRRSDVLPESHRSGERGLHCEPTKTARVRGPGRCRSQTKSEAT